MASEHSAEYQYFLDGASDVTMVLTQSETPYWQDPPTALALMVHNSQRIKSYGGAYECASALPFFHSSVGPGHRSGPGSGSGSSSGSGCSSGSGSCLRVGG